MILKKLDFDKIACPKCGKKHFVEDGFSYEHSVFDSFGFGFSDAVYRVPPKREYQDGKLVNPEDFIPEPTKQYFKCKECECKFSVKTTYGLNGESSNQIINEDEEELIRKEKLKEIIKKQKEESEKNEKVKTVSSNLSTVKVSDYIPTSTISDASYSTLSMTIGKGTASTIDLDGTIINSNKVFTDDQIKNIKDYFGFDVKNK